MLDGQPEPAEKLRIEYHTIGEIAQEFGTKAVDLVSPYSVGLIGVSRGAVHDLIKVVASGTLVKIDGIKGILTAQHVVDAITQKKCDYLGLTLSGEESRFFIETIQLPEPIRMSESFVAGAGPDIAFVVLPNMPKIGWLDAKKSFYDVSSLNYGALADIDKSVSCCWGLFGCPYEWKDIQYDTKIPHRVLILKAMFGLSNIEKEWAEDGFDYLDVAVRYSSQDTGPVNYEGVSGGGLWLLPLLKNLDTGLIECERVHLCGVAFLQTDKERVPKSIRCHGSKSIYKQLVSQVRAGYSAA